MIPFEKYYNLETYLFKEVSINFQKRGYLKVDEFFSIVIWKANRAKSKIARKKEFKKYSSLEEGVKALTQSLFITQNRKEKACLLMNNWNFQIPIASAILSILYPDEFSVYDYRVCDMLKKELKTDKYHKMKNLTFEKLWLIYEDYLKQVKRISDKNTFREADKYLWGKSFYYQLQIDLENNFK